MASPQVVPAATVTTDAKPHGPQQLARDLEVEGAVMGQRCRPQSFGEVSDVRTQNFLLNFPFDEIYRCRLFISVGRSVSAFIDYSATK